MEKDKILNFLNKLVKNPDSVDELNEQEVNDVRKYIDPLGVIRTNKSTTYANMSIINLREKYIKNLMTTGLIGYLYKSLNEYSNVSEYSLINDVLSEETKQVPVQLREKIIKEFLDFNFEFNPDIHLRPGSEEIKKPKSNDIIYKISANIDKKPEQFKKYMLDILMTSNTILSESKEVIGRILNMEIPDEHSDILTKLYIQLNDILNNVALLTDPLMDSHTNDITIISADTVYNIDRYIINNYDKLREITNTVYSIKPDIDFSIIFYGAFKTADEAKNQRIQHENEFRSDVYTIESGAVTLLGPFKENIERIDFYNKNTEVLKRMMDQLELDHKLGKDLMEKEIKRKKKINIRKDGPDDAGLQNYSKIGNNARELGVPKVFKEDEIKKYEKEMQEKYPIVKDNTESKNKETETDIESKSKETETDTESKSKENTDDNVQDDNDSMPDDSIEVGVFYTDQDNSLKKTKFYSQSEAPLHMQEGSEYRDKYQPIRKKPLENAYISKTVVDKEGKSRTLTVIDTDSDTD